MKAPLLIAFALVSCVPSAQVPLRIQPVFRNYSTDQGLPNNWVYDIIQDSKGYIWIATNSGVCRFDGYEFKQFPDTLHCNFTSVLGRCMMEDEGGRMWFVDIQKRVFYVEREHIIPWKYNEQLADFSKNVNCYIGLIVKGRGEEIWLGRSAAGITHVDEAGVHTLLPAPKGANRFLFENKYGWLETEPYLPIDKLFTQKTETVAVNDGMVQLPIPGNSNILTLDRNLHLYSTNRLSDGSWLLNRVEAYYCLKDNQLLWYRKAPEKATIFVFQDLDGAIFTGHYYGGGLKRYRNMDDFQDNKLDLSLLNGLTVSCILQDREGGYWIGTQERGVFYCTSFENGRLTGLPSLDESVIKAVVWDGKFTLYIGLFNGKVYEYNLQNLTARDISPPEVRLIHELFFDAYAQTLGLAGSANMLFQNGVWKTQHVFDPVYGKKRSWAGVRLSPTLDPDRWLNASGNGISQINIRTEKIERSTEQAWTGVNSGRFASIRMDHSGRIWASNDIGLVEWANDGIIPANNQYPQLRHRSRDMKIMPDTSLVLCPKGHGVVFWKPGRPPVEVNRTHGLLSDQVLSLYYDMSDSAIWACSSQGVNKLTPDGRGNYRIESFTMKHGLPSNTVNSVCVANHVVWMATDKGLYAMRKRPNASAIPAPIFASVLVNNVPYLYSGRLDLPHDSSNLSFEFVSLHYRSNGHIPYAYRLLHDGSDTVWSYGTRRFISFPNLTPGHYRLEVKAQNEAGFWSPVSRFEVTIRPPWYATWWAQGLGLSALASLAFIIYRYRITRIRHESRLVAEMHRLERAALQAQINPHFIFNCLNSIQLFILNNESDAAVRYLAKFARLIRNTLNASVSGFVTLETEVQILEHYLALECMRFEGRFDYRIEVDEQLDCQNTLLPAIIVQPIVENAVLHGMKDRQKDGHIHVAFRREGEGLTILVSDNGSGMGVETKHHDRISLGRGITRRRIEILREQNVRQDISIQYLVPEDGTGTCVQIKLPLSCRAKPTEP